MTPAERIISILGSADAVATVCGVHRSRVFRWTYPKDRGGTGGLVPAQHQQALLDAARARGLPLEPADFFRREEADAEGSASSEAAA